MAKVMSNANYATITPGQLLKDMPVLYASAIRRGDIGLQPAKILWGPPGIGKSEVVRQMADKVAELTGKKSVVTMASLLLMSPVDLRGIPTKDEVTVTGADGVEVKEQVARWLRPLIFQMDPSDDVINWLFLDELASAPPNVQAAAYQIVLDRRVGEHQFPKNCAVIAASNRVTDRAVAYKMPKPLANRFTHYEMTVSPDDWVTWAIQNGVRPEIIGYIRFNPDRLMDFDPATDDVAFVTPRSWALANQILVDCEELVKAYGGKLVDVAYPHLAGTVSARIATDLKTYVDVYASLPTWDGIASGKTAKCTVPADDLGALYALSSMISANMYAFQKENYGTGKKPNDKAVDKLLTTVGKYIQTIPRKDVSVLVLRDIMRSCDKMVSRIIANPVFSNAIRDVAELII